MTNNQYFHPLRPKYSCEHHDENCHHPTLTLPHFLDRPSSGSCTASGWLAGWMVMGLGGGGGVAMETNFWYAAPRAASRKRKEQPTPVTMETPSCESSSTPGPLPHLKPFGVSLPRHPTSHILLPDFTLFLSHPHILPSCTCLRVCCVYRCVPKCHLPDQEGGVALFIVARDREVPVGGAAVWVGPVLMTLYLQNILNILFDLQGRFTLLGVKGRLLLHSAFSHSLPPNTALKYFCNKWSWSEVKYKEQKEKIWCKNSYERKHFFHLLPMFVWD